MPENKLAQLQKAFDAAILSQNLSDIQGIIAELNAVPNEKKSEFRDFYFSIGQRLFEESTEISNYNSDRFVTEINEYANNKQKENGPKVAPTTAAPAVIKDDFHDVFLRFHNRSEKLLLHLKVHFLFRLHNELPGRTKLLILTNKQCANNPYLHRIIDKNNGDMEVEKVEISEFIRRCKDNKELTDQSYLCLLALLPDMNFADTDKNDVHELFQLFLKSYSVSLLKDNISSSDDYAAVKVDDKFLNDMELLCGIVFNNKDLTFEEERIIKSFFATNISILDYKVLKKGFSGSKVIEVRPVMLMSSKTARYVIKYAKVDEGRKVEKEQRSFKKFLDGFAIHGYQSEYKETGTYEAIKYFYASSDSKADSYPFAQLLDDTLLNKRVPYELDSVLEQLFKSEPLTIWAERPETAAKSVKAIYQEYINDAALTRTVGLIESKTSEEVEQGEFWQQYQQILNMELRYKKKVCHGDLHTENFFKDDKDVYLIDFGYTDYRHALLDHTTLEASLKFRHVPFYIPEQDLIETDNAMMNNLAFDTDFDVSFIRRDVLKRVHSLVLQIRKDAVTFLVDPEDKLEYFISLFIITARQIQYPDLNQRYAYSSAKALAAYIIANYG